jgi:cyanophycinase-like exopeptidase
LRNIKQCPIGGTSALNNSVTSAQVLANPYNNNTALGRNDFFNYPRLGNTVVDTHFDNPDRRGRLLTFMARINKDNAVVARGIGTNEQTAVCIEPNGTAKGFGIGLAFFMQQNGSSSTRAVRQW